MEPENSDVHAESSPATFEVPTEPAARDAWFKTGKLPESKTEDSASSEEHPAEGEEPKGKAAPASEPGKRNQEKGQQQRETAASRLKELLEDLSRAGLTPNELKTFKREAQGQSAQQQQQSADAAKAASEKTGNPAELKAPVKPKQEDFKTFEEYDSAKDKYYEDMVDFKAAKAVDEFRAGEAQKSQLASINARITDAVKRYGAGADGVIQEACKAFFEVKDGKAVPTVPLAVYSMIDGSPVWEHLAFTLGGKPDDLKGLVQLANSDPAAAIRKIVLMEHLINEELAKGGKPGAQASGDSEEESAATGTERDAAGKFKKPTPESKESNAPPPPREVSGRGTAPADEVESAVKADDFRKFFDTANRRDLNRR